MSRFFAISSALMAAGIAAFLSYVFALMTKKLAWRWDAVDRPIGERKQHREPVALWGGLGIAGTILLGVAGLFLFSFVTKDTTRPMQFIGFALGVLILALGGAWDDRKSLPPFVQILFPALASIVVIRTGTGIVHLTQPFTGHAFSLAWWQVLGVSLPADLITFAWLMAATYATKIQDGIDGLVSGLAAIGTGLVAALSLSPAFFQPVVAILSATVGGAFLGFLPRNFMPAKQFLGEAGSTIAGFSLGVLAILSSAKLAIALCVLAIPIADVGLVIFGRIRRGVPWFKGDRTHLHFRLLAAGMSQGAAALLLWSVSLFAGILALTVQTRGKIFIVVTLMVCTALASFVAGFRAERRNPNL